MNRTVTLLQSLKQALQEKKLSAADFPLADVQSALETELGVYQNTFETRQYEEVLVNIRTLYADVCAAPSDTHKLVLYLDACICVLSMISQAVLSLVNRPYWEMRHRDRLEDPHVQQILAYIERHGQVKLIPYEFMSEYDAYPCEVQWDAENGMPYMMHGKRAMYFPAAWGEEDILSYYRTLLAEQDPRSPHCYQKEGYGVRKGDVVLDAGAAEGIFALNALEAAEKLYLVECDPMWQSCLRLTFKDELAGGKAVLVDKYLGEFSDADNITIDDIVACGALNYIKMDIEGFEKPALKGGARTLQAAEDMRMAICSYHCREDETWISDFLRQMSYEVTTSDGYMSPDWTVESILEAQLRRGVVFGRRAGRR